MTDDAIDEGYRKSIEELYRTALAFTTVKDEPNLLVVFPNTPEGFDDRMAAAQAFAATHRKWSLNEKEDFVEIGEAREGENQHYPYAGLYLPTELLQIDGGVKRLPELTVLTDMAEGKRMHPHLPHAMLRHFHGEHGNEEVMHRLETWLHARDTAHTLIETDRVLAPERTIDRLPEPGDGIPPSTNATDIHDLGKLKDELGLDEPRLN